MRKQIMKMYDQEQLLVTRKKRKKRTLSLESHPRLCCDQQLWNKITQILFVLVCTTGILLGIVTLHNYYPVEDPIGSIGILDKLSLMLGAHEQSAVVILDLRTTMSIIHVYTFQRHNYDGTFHISSELKEIHQPGIFDPNFKNDFEIDTNILELVHVASALVAKSKNVLDKPVPIVAKICQDSFRQMDLNTVEKTTKFLENHLSDSVFKFDAEKSIGLLEKSEERVLQWFAINLVHHHLQNHNMPSSGIIVDLGEDHLEIVFSSIPGISIPKERVIDVNQISSFGSVIKLVTLRIPDVGLFKIRNVMLMSGLNETSNFIHSECVNPLSQARWSYQGRKFQVFGKDKPDFELVKERNGPFAGKKINKPVANMEQCRQLANNALEQKVSFKEFDSLSKLFQGKQIFLEGLLLEKCLERGLTLPHRGGVVHQTTFSHSTIHACKVPNTEQPFACLDMIYMEILLKRVLGLKKTFKLFSSRRINGMTAEWPLAAAFHIYENGL